MDNVNFESVVCPDADVTMLEKTVVALPFGCAGAVALAESNPDVFLASAPLATTLSVGGLFLTRYAVNQPINPENLAEISDAENEANLRNAKVSAVAAGVAGVVSKYELIRFLDSGNIKELAAGVALTGAAGFWGKISLSKYRNFLGRQKLEFEQEQLVD